MTLAGCTKQKAEYEVATKFVYNDVQESQKEIVEEKETTENQSLAVDSLGREEDDPDDGVVEIDMGDGGVAVIQEFDSGIPDVPDVPLEDLEDLELEIVTEEPVTEAEVEEAPPVEMTTEEPPEVEDVATEAPAEETTVTEAPPVTEEITTEAPATEVPTTEVPPAEEITTETPTSEEPVTEAPPAEEPVTEAPTTETPSTEAPATEAPATEAPSTELPGDESGEGDSTEETPSTEATDTPSGGGEGEAGDEGTNEEMPGDSDDASGGTGESGTGETGGGESGGGESGGDQSGDNGTGNNDEGTGGSGDGGNGEGGDGDIGGDEPTDPGIGGNPDEVVKIWYEGTLGTYIWGEAVDTSGLTVYAEFGDGRTEEVEGYSVNMNYPERTVVTDTTASLPITYTPGVYKANISYQNAQVECSYNLVAHFVSIYVVYYGSCSDPEGHNARYHENELYSTYICDEEYGCFEWEYDEQGRHSVTISTHTPKYFPVYYDYTYSIDDLMSDDYYANVNYDLNAASISGGPINIYKDTVISEGYYTYTFARDMNIVYHDMEKMKEEVAKWKK